MSAADIINRLQYVRATGNGKWHARCPAHEDRDPSLSIAELPDGRTLLHCHAGCGGLDVLSAIGLGWDALYPAGSERFRPAFRRPSDDQHERIVLELTEADRKSGKRLSRADLEREKQAWMRVHKGAA
jgi:hypothetical protein